MPSPDETLLCRYHYDPLDRLADCTPSAQAHTQRFYLKERLTSEIQGSVRRSIFQQDDQLLAQQQRQDGGIETTLLATDQQRSVLHALDATQRPPLAYTPYGHRPAENGLLSLLGFNGERPDPVTGHYLLGNGYRAFNPVLMRFNSPDSMSPFGRGGVNAYAYTHGNPVNTVDPSGHFGLPKSIKLALRIKKPKITIDVHGVQYRAPSDRLDAVIFTAPTKKYPEPGFVLKPEQDTLPIRNRLEALTKESEQLINLEKSTAHMIAGTKKPNLEIPVYRESLSNLQTKRQYHEQNLKKFKADLDNLTNEIMDPPTYVDAIRKEIGRRRSF
ncbi:RHS repeat-associated core domain-containing protein [Pseudomonas zanjanensis]|uniref:RHS repeat-associated core domain-containing protein n=1 Tax=Pseudomonas zanjanensis TaxID=2745496 RepID=UPI001CEC42E6|nr:RHS repeat-associated core domain-containing protein [Pseudomonas zanjanensis]